MKIRNKIISNLFDIEAVCPADLAFMISISNTTNSIYLSVFRRYVESGMHLTYRISDHRGHGMLGKTRNYNFGNFKFIEIKKDILKHLDIKLFN